MPKADIDGSRSVALPVLNRNDHRKLIPYGSGQQWALRSLHRVRLNRRAIESSGVCMSTWCAAANCRGSGVMLCPLALHRSQSRLPRPSTRARDELNASLRLYVPHAAIPTPKCPLLTLRESYTAELDLCGRKGLKDTCGRLHGFLGFFLRARGHLKVCALKHAWIVGLVAVARHS